MGGVPTKKVNISAKKIFVLKSSIRVIKSIFTENFTEKKLFCPILDPFKGHFRPFLAENPNKTCLFLEYYFFDHIHEKMTKNQFFPNHPKRLKTCSNASKSPYLAPTEPKMSFFTLLLPYMTPVAPATFIVYQAKQSKAKSKIWGNRFLTML